MKKILVPTDFSELAYYALKVAASIAKKMNAEIHLLHIADMPVYGAGVPGQEAMMAMREKMEGVGFINALDKEWDRLLGQPFLKGIKATKHLGFEGIYDSIKNFVDENEVDLVVMGSHGAKGLQELFGGSNTEKVVRIVDAPVLVIKKDIDNFTLKNIVFASNFFGEVKDAFKRLIELSETYNATIHLLKVVTPGDFERTSYSKKIMKDFADKFKLQNYTINTYNEASIEDGINGFSKEINPDLVCLTTHGFTGVARLLSGGSIAEDIVNHAKLPVMTIKIKKPDLRKGAIFPD